MAGAKDKRDDESSSPKVYPLDSFLDESFAKSFAEVNLLPRLNLSGYAISDCKVNQLKSRRRKPVIEIKLHLLNEDNNNQPQISVGLIGKYRNDGLLEGVFDLLQELWDKASFCSQENQYLRICTPIGYFSNHKLMVTSKAPGIELGKILLQLVQEDGDTNEKAILIESYVLQAARWLAKLHKIDKVRDPRSFSLEKEEIKLKEWSGHLSQLYPDFAEKISSMFSNILDRERGLHSESFVLIHGDFNPNNIFIDDINSKMTVIDFEQSCIFDPAKDLGYFIAKLESARTKYNLPLDTEHLQKRFLDTYHITRKSPSSISEQVERIGLFKARSYLQHLHFRYWSCRRNHPPDSTDCKYWMKKAEDYL